MTTEEADALPVGIYRLYWHTGGYSVASVGRDRQGHCWFAPANWIAVPGVNWDTIASAELIERAFANCDG